MVLNWQVRLPMLSCQRRRGGLRLEVLLEVGALVLLGRGSLLLEDVLGVKVLHHQLGCGHVRLLWGTIAHDGPVSLRLLLDEVPMGHQYIPTSTQLLVLENVNFILAPCLITRAS